jgi:hypothetical protein
MDVQHVEQMQAELSELLRKQKEVLDSRMLGTASESDLLEYEVRQEIVHEMCNQLVRAISR